MDPSAASLDVTAMPSVLEPVVIDNWPVLALAVMLLEIFPEEAAALIAVTKSPTVLLAPAV
jgi:hypothetical protein